MKQIKLNTKSIDQKANTPDIIIQYINKINYKNETILETKQPIIEEMFSIFSNKKAA